MDTTDARDDLVPTRPPTAARHATSPASLLVEIGRGERPADLGPADRWLRAAFDPAFDELAAPIGEFVDSWAPPR